MTHFLRHKIVLVLGFISIMFHGEARLVNNSPELTTTIETLEKLPEAKALIAEVEKQGPVRVVYMDMPGQELEGFWNASARQIEVNRSLKKTTGSLVCTVLFELHNAKTSQRLIQITDMARNNQISKDEFVSSVERMEHQNALNASNLLEKGIKMGVYPADARWPIYYQFDTHYKLQQVLQHSKWLANHYDKLNKIGPKQELKGTIPGLNKFSEADRRDFLRYLWIKNDLESPFEEQQQKAFTALSKEYGKIEACVKGSSNPGECVRVDRKLELMELAFGGHPAFEEIAMGASSLGKK